MDDGQPGGGVIFRLTLPATVGDAETVFLRDPMFLERALLLIPLLLLGGFFAGTETALLSLSRAQREGLVQQADQGDARSNRILRLLDVPQRLITTLILGNEVVNISISTLMTGLR